MKRISVAILSLTITLAACNSDDKAASSSATTNAEASTTSASIDTNADTGTTVLKLLAEEKPEVVAKAKEILEKPELTPTQLLREVNKLRATNGISGMSVAMCAADKQFMDTTMKLAARLEKALGLNMMGMINSSVKQQSFDEKTYNIKNEKITGNTATVEVTDKKTNKTQTLNFVKENGTWKMCENVAGKSNKGQDPLQMMNMMLKMVEGSTPEGKEKFKKMMQQSMESMKSLENAKADTTKKNVKVQ